MGIGEISWSLRQDSVMQVTAGVNRVARRKRLAGSVRVVTADPEIG